MMYNNFDVEFVTKECISWIQNLFNNNFGSDKNAVVAISGGKDSSVVATLCVEALEKYRVKAILLPQYEQSDIDYSLELVKHLGIEYKIINIGKTVDSIINEMKKNGVKITEQALINIPARVRMVETYFYAQCINGIPSCNCNLSEDWIGYSTYGGDGFGSFSPLSNLTTDEVIAIGDYLGLPTELTHKIPSDGLCGKTDEDNLGFTYETLNKYIRTGVCEDEEIKKKIDSMHEKNLFKLELMPSFMPNDLKVLI